MPTVRYTVANGQIIAGKRAVRRFYQTDALGSVIGLQDASYRVNLGFCSETSDAISCASSLLEQISGQIFR